MHGSSSRPPINSVLLFGSVILNAVLFFFLAWNTVPMVEDLLWLTGSLCLLLFVCLHGWFRYGWNKLVVFFGLAAVISWSTESLSVLTGFPFGRYHYTDLLGDKLGDVPILIMPAYFFMGYLAWTMGNLFAGNRGTGIKKGTVVLVPIISTFIMVLWDVCFDPIQSTIEGKWIWEVGGAYFGVPLSNYLGWFLTVYLIFQSFAAYLDRFGRNVEMTAKAAYWYLVPVLYAVQGLPYFLYPFFRADHLEIYQPISLLTIFTMFLVAFLNIVVIQRSRGDCQAD